MAAGDTLLYEAPVGEMPEAEVSLRLALHILDLAKASLSVTVCLDDIHVECKGKRDFPVTGFLSSHGWQLAEAGKRKEWLGTYRNGDRCIVVSSNSRAGDVIGNVNGKRIRAECKGGRLGPQGGNPENKQIHEAIGQLMTGEQYLPEDVLLVAMPLSSNYRSKQNWQFCPLMRKLGISLVMIGRDGVVEGMPTL